MLRKYLWRWPATAISSNPSTPCASTTGWRSWGALRERSARRSFARRRARAQATRSAASASNDRAADAPITERSYSHGRPSRGGLGYVHVVPRAPGELVVVVVKLGLPGSARHRRVAGLVVGDDPQLGEAAGLELAHPLAGEVHDRTYLLERDAAAVGDVEGAGVGDLPQLLVG